MTQRRGDIDLERFARDRERGEKSWKQNQRVVERGRKRGEREKRRSRK